MPSTERKRFPWDKDNELPVGTNYHNRTKADMKNHWLIAIAMALALMCLIGSFYILDVGSIALMRSAGIVSLLVVFRELSSEVPVNRD